MGIVCGIIIIVAVFILNGAIINQFDIVWESRMYKTTKIYCIVCIALLLAVCNSILIYIATTLFYI